MTTSSTFPRTIAILLATAVMLGLAALALVPGGDRTTVPSGAKAGQLDLEPCTYSTGAGPRKADCGTLVVPENRRDPGSRLIALPVTRVRATADDPGPPIFRLGDGPGITNTRFEAAGRFTDRHDVVMVGYRGVDGSSRLDCPEVTGARRWSADLLSDASARASARGLRDCAERLEREGTDLAGYSLPQRATDLEAVRAALGYEQIDLVSEGMGTRIAMIYAARHPERIHRSVMIAANPPGGFVWDPAATAGQLRRIGGGADATAEQMRRVARDMPDRWGPLHIASGNARLGAFAGLMEATEAANPLSSPATVDAWRAADEGDPSGLWLESLLARVLLPHALVWGDVAAVSRADAAAAAEHFARRDVGRSPIGDPASELVWAGGRALGAWPANADDDAFAELRDSEVETLVISGELGGAAPAASATRGLMPHLPNGRQVVLPGFGHTVDFWNNQESAGRHLIAGFLETGRVDASRYVRQAYDRTPTFTQPGLARTVAGGSIAIAFATVLALALVAFRVRRQGQLGRGSRVAMRTVVALLVGFGGWFVGALVALTVLPGVPVDSLVLALASIGVPAALSASLGWADRAQPATARWAAFAAAIAGALLGGLLGFHAVESPLALLTTIPGAVAGANLALALRDVRAGRDSAPRPAAFAEPPTKVPA